MPPTRQHKKAAPRRVVDPADVPVARPEGDWTKSRKLCAFIVQLSHHGNVTRALLRAKCNRMYAYDKRATDQDFADAWATARAMGLETLKDVAWSRAVEGTEEALFYQGEPIMVGKGKNRRQAVKVTYSDSLLMFKIKQLDPSYREHFDVNLGNAGGRPFMFQMMLDPKAAQVAQQQQKGGR
jgi:hypothetical protein